MSALYSTAQLQDTYTRIQNACKTCPEHAQDTLERA